MAEKGRPSKFSEEIANEICDRIVGGESLRHICEDKDMPSPSMVFRWLADEKYKTFREQYTRACEERTEAFVEDIFAIADDGTNDWMEKHYGEHSESTWVVNGEALQRSKLRVDARKWYASKMKPKKYGERIDMTTNGKDIPAPILGGVSVTHTKNDIKPES